MELSTLLSQTRPPAPLAEPAPPAEPVPLAEPARQRPAPGARGFHGYRGNHWAPTGLYGHAWAVADRVALPPRVGHALRLGINGARRLRVSVRGPGAPHGAAVRRDAVLAAGADFAPTPAASAAAAFEAVHRANEALLRPDGSWDPHPFAEYAGRGVSVEEAALRVPSYLHAFDATGREVYRARAEAAGEHLLRRTSATGDLHLQAHLVPDLPYGFAGAALLALWDRDRAGRPDLLDAARRIGDRLLDYPIAGSVNHACAPVWTLAPLYTATGDARYLRAAVRRVRRTALAFQLPDGAWAGHESWMGYHGITTRALVELYAALPFFPEWYRLKDALAATITAALNRFVLAQDASGRLHDEHPSASERERKGRTRVRSKLAAFDGREFRPAEGGADADARGYEVDALAAAHALLGVDARPMHGLMAHALGPAGPDGATNRYDLKTLAVGRYLSALR